MTDRFNGFIVVLEENLRSDDAESTINAIRHIKGVLDVIPNVADFNSAVAEQRVRADTFIKLRKALFNE